MAGGGDDHIVARHIEGRQIRAVDFAVGDHGGKVIPRIGAPVFGDFAEISSEIIDDRHDHFGKLFRAELFPDPRGIGILRSEQFLGEFEHPRFVLLRHTENFHDDMQWISERDVGDEIAAPAMRHHPLDRAARDGADPFLEFSEIDRHEPGLRQCAIFGMIGRIHLNQRAHQVRGAGDLAYPLLERLGRKRGRAVRIMKKIVLPADGLDVGVFGHHPEWIEALRPRNAERIVGPKPAIGIMKAMIGIGRRIHQRRGRVGRKIDFDGRAHNRTLRFSWSESLAQASE